MRALHLHIAIGCLEALSTLEQAGLAELRSNTMVYNCSVELDDRQLGVSLLVGSLSRKDMDFRDSKPAQVPYLAAGVGYVVLHLALLFGLAWLFEGEPGSLVSTSTPSLAYYVLMTAFGTVILALSLRRVDRYWWPVVGVVLVMLVGSRFVLGSVTGLYSVIAVFGLVLLPYLVAAGVVLRLIAVRLPFSWLRRAPSHPATVRALLIAGALLTGTIGGSVVAVAAAPPAVPPTDWSADRQFAYLERTDQADRRTGAMVDRSRDYRRAERVLELLRAGRAESPDDWLSAAIVLQHGTCAGHFEIAHRLAAAANDSEEIEATGWVRVTYDRWQVAAGNEQRYGTQTGLRTAGRECHPPVPETINVDDPLGG